MKWDQSLPSKRYSDWYDAIRYDDVIKATSILDTATPAEKHRLLNGVFTYETLGSIPAQHKRMDLSRPLLLAATFGSLGVLGLMLRTGANPETTEDSGCNLIHALGVVMAYSKNDKMIKSYRFLVQNLKPEVLKRLLLGESTLGLRPVEFAAQQGCFELMLEILNTDDIYVIRRDNVGVTQYVWCDVTEYENEAPAGRRHLSMLNFLENMDIGTLGCGVSKSMMRRGVMASWMTSKQAAYKPFFFLWAIIRVIHIVGYFVLDLDTGNLIDFGGVSHLSSVDEQSNATFVYCENYSAVAFKSSTRYVMEIVMIVLSSGSLLVTLMLKISRMRRSNGHNLDRLLTGKRSVLKQSQIYDIGHILYCFLSLAYVTITISRAQINIVFIDMLRVALIFSALFSVCYFVQLAPGIGHYIITLNRMMVDLLRFAIVFAFIQVPFVIILTNVMNTHGMKCTEDFSNQMDGFFTVFRMMLNLVDVTQYDIRYKYVLYVIHLQYVFIISILLINFLIAVMAHSVDVVNDNRPLIMSIQKLWVSSQIQDFLLFFCPKIHEFLIRRELCIVDEKVCVAFSRCSTAAT